MPHTLPHNTTYAGNMPQIQPPVSIAVGTIRYNNGVYQIYTGSSWISVTSGEELNMTTYTVAHKAKNVNSKRLYAALVSTAGDIVNDYIYARGVGFSRTYVYKDVVEYIDAYLEELNAQKEITTYDVIGDFRNNDPMNASTGVIHILVKYQQFNCLNITELDFTITASN